MFDAKSFIMAGEKIFIYQPDGEPMTYGEASSRIDDIVDSLSDCDGRLCLFFFQNDVGSVLTYIALMRAGCIPVPLPPDLSQAAVSNYSKAYGCELIAGNEQTMLDFPGQVRCQIGSVTIKAQDCLETSVPLSKNCALLLATSGSTGDMKAIRVSHLNINEVSSSIVEYLGLSSKDVLATSLPLYYSYGLSVLHAAIYCHAALSVGQFSLLDKKYWKQLAVDKVTVLSAVPSMLNNLSKLGFDQLVPTTLRVLTVAGGRLSNLRTEEYLDLSLRLGFSFFSMYGATEASPRMSYVPPEKARQKLGSAGIPIPGGSFSIDPRGIDEDGEIVYRGLNVALGYATERSDLDKDDEFRGCLHTGDLGYLDQDGFLYVTGRIKRISKQQGVRLNLDHLETILSEHSIEGMVIEMDEQLTVVIVEGDVGAVKEALGSCVSRAVKFRVMKIKNFPTNANGKRDYKALTETLKERIA